MNVQTFLFFLLKENEMKTQKKTSTCRRNFFTIVTYLKKNIEHPLAGPTYFCGIFVPPGVWNFWKAWWSSVVSELLRCLCVLLPVIISVKVFPHLTNCWLDVAGNFFTFALTVLFITGYVEISNANLFIHPHDKVYKSYVLIIPKLFTWNYFCF